MIRLILALIITLTPLASLSANRIELVSRGDANADYAIGMIKLALSKSSEDYQLNINEGALTGLRQKQKLIDGEVDVVWTATNKYMEQGILPVRVPLYKGLLGFRVLLVHRENKNLFHQVRTMTQLSRFSFGQGFGWSDTEIMRANGLTVVTANKYESLFHMTDGKRFDAYPRGIHEPWLEMENRPDLALAVDDSILLVYKMPFYLFVNPAKKELANALEQGLLAAIEDGSFDQFFYSSSTVKMVLNRVNLDSRRVFRMDNPGLPEQTPVANHKLWIDLEQLRQRTQLSRL